MSLHNFFHKGAIPPKRVSEVIEEINLNFEVGAHSIFLGKIRQDITEEGKVKSIIYTANQELCLPILGEILTEASDKYDIQETICLHSLGEVKVGEICLLVLVTSAHRSACQEGMDYVIEAIKKRLPIFGKEVVEDGSYQWKTNTEKMKAN